MNSQEFGSWWRSQSLGTINDRIKDTDEEKWHWLTRGTFTERKPRRNGKNKLESDEHLESEESCMLPKVVGCDPLYMHVVPDIKVLSEKMLK